MGLGVLFWPEAVLIGFVFRDEISVGLKISNFMDYRMSLNIIKHKS